MRTRLSARGSKLPTSLQRLPEWAAPLALAEISSVALATEGSSAIVATSHNARRAGVALGDAALPNARAHGFGPAGVFDLALGVQPGKVVTTEI
jgi:hypothetical protein